jgi:hypothetical protein
MQFIEKNPLSTFLVLVYMYTLLFGKGWAFARHAVFDSVAIIFLLLLIYFTSNLVWKDRFLSINTKIRQNISVFPQLKPKKKLTMVLSYALLALVVLAVGEIAATIILYGNERLLAVGFPYPAYSFVVGRLLFWGIFLNMLFYVTTILLLFKLIILKK